MNRYSSLSDDFYVNMNLSTEMELPTNRESILHYFETSAEEVSHDAEFLLPRKGGFHSRRGQGAGPLSLEHDRNRGGCVPGT